MKNSIQLLKPHIDNARYLLWKIISYEKFDYVDTFIEKTRHLYIRN